MHSTCAIAVWILIRFARILHYGAAMEEFGDRKSTRLNSSHVSISYAVFCLKKKKQEHEVEADGFVLNRSLRRVWLWRGEVKRDRLEPGHRCRHSQVRIVRLNRSPQVTDPRA